jgi:alcohol dehydrogenase class IV
VSSALEAARQQWAEANRRLEAHASDPELYRRLLTQLEAATEELRKRVGETFTLDELAGVYGGSDDWMRDAVDERVPAGSPRQLALVQDAAFHLYSRGATDYAP